jgi:hypothetical protein
VRSNRPIWPIALQNESFAFVVLHILNSKNKTAGYLGPMKKKKIKKENDKKKNPITFDIASTSFTKFSQNCSTFFALGTRQAIPTFTMGSSILPSSVRQKLAKNLSIVNPHWPNFSLKCCSVAARIGSDTLVAIFFLNKQTNK